MKVLIYGDPLHKVSGINEVSCNILQYFYLKDYEVAYCFSSKSDSQSFNALKIHDIEYPKELKIFNCYEEQDTFDNIIKEYKPDIVFSIHDLWNFDLIAFSCYRDTFKWIAYCPIEGEYYSDHIILPTEDSFRKSLRDITENIDVIIPYNNMGYKVLNELSSKGNVVTPIPNGIYDIELPEKIDRQEVFKEVIKEDDFVFMTTGAGFQRKGLAYVVEAFSEFLKLLEHEEKDITKYKLYIHGNVDSVNSGTDLKSMIYYLGLNDNIIYSKPEPIRTKELYKRYRCCDCYIGLPLAEGFGLGFAEAMINKLPIIAHEYGGHTEYLQSFFKVMSDCNFYPNNHYALWKIPCTRYAIKGMTSISLFPESFGKENIKLNYNYAKENLIWKQVYKKFDEIIDPYIESITPNIINELTIRRIV